MKQIIAWLLGPSLFLTTWLLGNMLGFEPGYVQVCAVALWMISWWIGEAVPMAATALLPVVLFPFFGIATVEQVCANYANSTIFLFLGGFIIAMGLEKSGLHERIALLIIRNFGRSANGILFGFLLATTLLSMWVSNTSTALMMLPMARSIIKLLESKFSEAQRSSSFRNFSIALTLGIAYAANVGGIATLIGTPPNVVLKGQLEKLAGIQIDFLAWMQIGIPISLLMLLIVYFSLNKLFFPNNLGKIEGGMELIQSKLMELGQLKKAEKYVLAIFCSTAFLWISGPWWNDLIGKKLFNDTLVAILGGLAMFSIPTQKDFKGFVLEWEDTKSLPWNILLLFGGGLALAFGMKESGLMNVLGESLTQLDLHPFVLLLVLTCIMLLLTEVMSNVALAIIFIPVVITLCDIKGLDTLTYTAAVALASSFAFMLPISTPPNAIVYGAGYIKIKDMIRVGFVLNLISIALISAFLWIFR
ncbi:MAG: DASS family sodium-coupled anion symporter [Bacteroidetes bacterium]|nr:MAG: DASS family sodium-coupled anion symporter [Bacteroidota bacterium]